jgi:ElaB/YqjD/DUF883 family membrane-anchored ribosome-binding protein
MSNGHEESGHEMTGTQSFRDTAERAIHTVREGAEEAYEKGVEKARDFGETIENYVQEKPIQSLLIAAAVALGVGVVAGTLIRR